MQSKLTTCPFLARCWIFQNSWCISDKIDTCVSIKVFFQKIMSKLQSTCSSNLTRFLRFNINLTLFLQQHYSPLQNARMCIIWTHLNKLFHGSRHNIRHFASETWIFVYNSSFLRTIFKIFAIFLVFIFPQN